jgi:hypothetical protein
MIEDFDSNAPSRGLGDTIAKITHATGIAKAVEVVTEALGIEDCGCSGRQEWLNGAVPYNVEANSLPNSVKSNSPQVYDRSTAIPAEEGIYEVMHEIHATKAGQKINYSVGEKVLLTQENLLYSDWPYYLIIGAVKKIN